MLVLAAILAGNNSAFALSANTDILYFTNDEPPHLFPDASTCFAIKRNFGLQLCCRAFHGEQRASANREDTRKRGADDNSGGRTIVAQKR